MFASVAGIPLPHVVGSGQVLPIRARGQFHGGQVRANGEGVYLVFTPLARDDACIRGDRDGAWSGVRGVPHRFTVSTVGNGGCRAPPNNREGPRPPSPSP